MDFSDKNQLILRQEVERLQLEQKKNLQEMKNLTSRLDKALESSKEANIQKNAIQKSGN